MGDGRICITKGSVLKSESYHHSSTCLWEWSTKGGELVQETGKEVEAVKSLRRKES